jgi:hypothetical protein
MNAGQAKSALIHELNVCLSSCLKTLLETKFLYQSLTALDYDKLFEDYVKKVDSYDRETFKWRSFRVPYLTFLPSEVEFQTVDAGNECAGPTLLLQNVKLFCDKCDANETFSPTVYRDVTQMIWERHAKEPRVASPPVQYQLFTLAYQCETCKASPVVFTVKRLEWKLTLEGRSPIEKVQIPSFIPKTEAWLFRSAVVASRTGNVLAGIFYLRCFIDQFARRQTGLKGRQTGDEITDAYQSLLPLDKRDHMPSLKSCYERLSAPIHEAKEDVELFEAVKNEVVEHFDFRRIYKIPDNAKEQPKQSESTKTAEVVEGSAESRAD